MSETDTPDCPLCMETFEIDDLHFYPCTCGYQICRFCWHRIRTDENGLCPACRKTYTEDPAMYRPLTQDEIQKVKKERKQKDAQHKQKISANRQHLSNIRVIQKHLVFVVGLSNKMADADVLRRPEYFGKYGKIVKIVINPNTNYAGPQGPSASAYVTYTKEQDALKAILSINNSQPPLKIRASLGTTKYCTHYLRNMPCPKADCMYLHEVGDGEASFTKEDMQAGKHQLFEKNLLDNYIASLQQQRKLQKSMSESSDTEQVDSAPPEDWNEDVDSGDSVLPSRASWGTSKENKLVNGVQSSHAVEYPDLDSSIKVSSSSPPVHGVITSGSRNTSDTPKEESVLNPAEEKTVISGVWPTSTDSLDEPVENNENPTNSWPCINDLGLTDLKINPSDDELGFDPFAECKSGLEDLMATEKHQGLNSSSQPQPSFRWDSFWSSSYMPNQNSMSMLNSYSLFGAQQQMSLPHMMPYRPPNMNTYQPSQTMPPNTMPMNAPSTAAQFRFMSPQQSSRFPSQQMPVPSFSNHSNLISNPLLPQQQSQMQNQHQFMNQYRFPPPSQQPAMRMGTQDVTTVSTTAITSATSTIGPSTDNKNWQDGLRALLPNINISFANQQRDKLSASDSLNEIETGNSLNSPPPPGFTGIPGLPVKQTEKAVRPPPPPGFNKSTTDMFSPTPGILNLPSSLQISSSHGAVSVVSKPVTTTTTLVSSAHEDPSILWSKVLSDKHKEIDTVNMAFPLPGETIKQGANLETSNVRTTLPQPQSANLTSWNTVVSGNPSGKNSHKLQEEELLKHRTPLHIAAKESDDVSKPQKPSPIFGSQQKQGVKKPTAHVKPLKSNNADGFTTVQGSRQPTATQNVNSYTGSRVSELDDFGSDFMLPSSSSSVLVTGENNTSSKVSAKKKKRRNKDQIEHISEVIVGRVEAERPPITILDDERPKKVSKTKKKTGQKPSPPQQRKSPPLLSKYEQQKNKEQAPAPTIRILKSDGNHSGTTMLSPIQATASSDTKTNGVHDHEIVSRLTESTEKLLKNVLFETEAIKTNTEQISKDLKSALEKCKESSLSLSDLEKINLLLTPGKLPAGELDDSDLVDTSDLERQVESARREAKMLEARLNDVIRKNMASELETLKRNTKGSGNSQ